MSATIEPGTIMGMRSAYVELIKSKLPAVKTVEAHPGYFEADSMKRLSGKAPAVYVAFRGTDRGSSNGGEQVELMATFAAFVVTVGASDMRDAQGINLSEMVAALVLQHPESVPAGGQATDFEITSLGSANGNSNGSISLFGVSWKCEIQVGMFDNFLFDELDDPTVYLGDLAGADVVLDYETDETLVPLAAE
ncbi:MAG: phage protein Gp37 [Pseudomonadota bacterium]